MRPDTPRRSSPESTRLLPWLVPAGDDGLLLDSIMLCEISGGELQTVSLRIAADHARLCGQQPISES